MKRIIKNLPLDLGLLLYATNNIIYRFINMPDILYNALNMCAIAFFLWGAVIIARSPEMGNSKLRRWKMRLIGKE